ncbi:SurA N-terminal domain-containing protein [Desulfurobacterium sp.]
MKRLVLPLLLAIALASGGKARVIDYVEVTVNGIPILHSEIKKFQIENGVSEKEAINQLVNQSLLLAEARKEGLSIDEKTLQTALEKLAKANGYDTVEEFKKAVEKRGLPWQSVKIEVRNQLLIQKLLAVKVKKNLNIPEREIDNICKAEGTRAREVYYVVTENATLANEIASLLKKGTPFANATTVCTEENRCKSGFIGNVKKGMLLKPIDSIVWSARIGTPRVVTINGKSYVIFVKSEKNLPCDREKIKEKLIKKAYAETLKELVKNLKSTAHIEYFKP